MKRKLLLHALISLLLFTGGRAEDVKNERLKEVERKLAELRKEKAELEAKSAVPKPSEVGGLLNKEGYPDLRITNAVLIIEGDRSSGTGFIGSTGGKKYVYTAARTLSGNTKLTIRNCSGISFKKIGNLEAAKGADLVRMEVTEEVRDSLEFYPARPPVQINRKIAILGTDVKNRMVTVTQCLVLGTSADALEVNNEELWKDQNGPVVDVATGKVVGLTTGVRFGEKTVWTEGTRQGQARFFATRLDRDWTWQAMTVGKFLADGKALQNHIDLITICRELADMESGGQRTSPYRPGPPNYIPWYKKFPDHELVKAYSQLGKLQGGSAESRKQMRNLLVLAYSKLKNSKAELKPESLAGYHRDLYETYSQPFDHCLKALDQAVAALK